MPLNKVKENSNMYQWVTHTHTHLGGRCSHDCKYCYVDNPRFGRPKKYQGEIRLIEKELNVNYGEDKSIFIENCNDLFASQVNTEIIMRVLKHCCMYPDNQYIFQTKNPSRYFAFIEYFPDNFILGSTIETNFTTAGISKAPYSYERYQAMKYLKGTKTFITIEPILDFDLSILTDWIIEINPDYVNIGADSKNNDLPEPEWDKVSNLIENLKSFTQVNIKNNLKRLKK